MVFVKHPGITGRAGELVLAGRYVVVDGQHVPLRGLKLGGSGHDESQTSGVLTAVIGLPFLLVQGGDVVVPAGARGQAKLVVDTIPPPTPNSTPLPPVAPATALGPQEYTPCG